MEINNFDYLAWENLVNRYFANKQILKFKMRLDYNDGKVSLKFSMTDENKIYVPALETLIIDICKGAALVMCKTFNAYYAEDVDYKDENKKIFDLMQKETGNYLKTLFDQGLEGFFSVMHEQMLLLESVYTIQHMKYDVSSHQWLMNGEKLNNGYVHGNDGISYSKVNSVIYQLLGNSMHVTI